MRCHSHVVVNDIIICYVYALQCSPSSIFLKRKESCLAESLSRWKQLSCSKCYYSLCWCSPSFTSLKRKESCPAESLSRRKQPSCSKCYYAWCRCLSHVAGGRDESTIFSLLLVSYKIYGNSWVDIFIRFESNITREALSTKFGSTKFKEFVANK